MCCFIDATKLNLFTVAAPTQRVRWPLENEFLSNAPLAREVSLFVFTSEPSSRFSIWLKHYYPKSRENVFEKLSQHSYIGSIHGALAFLETGVGWTVLPSQCVDVRKGIALCFHEKAANKRHQNAIYISTLKDRVLPRRVQIVIEKFMEMHPEISG
jgi:hypothetical protein